MTHEMDEARLTAYALGELEAGEAKEVEALLARDPAARAEVDAIRAFAGSLETELGKEAAPGLTKMQKERIAVAASADRPRFSLRKYAIAAAALIAVMLVTAQWKLSESRSDEQSGTAARESELGRGDRSRAPEAVPSATDVKAEAAELDRRRHAGLENAFGKSAAPTPVFVGELLERKKVGEATKTKGGVLCTNLPQVYLSRADLPPGTTIDDFEVEIAQAAVLVPRQEDPNSVEAYAAVKENAFVRALGEDARSTFGLDVDTASYSNVRRLLKQGQKPDKGAIRLEELINYFDYDYKPAKPGQPFSITLEVGACPWAPAHRLALIGLKAKSIDREKRPRANLVFLIDVSGSMQPANKLPLVKRSLRMLAAQLMPEDRVAMVVYAGSSGLVLPSTPARERSAIVEAIDRLEAGGSTNGAQGIELAYSIAKDHFVTGGVNRVILCTDGDFNVGVTSQSSLVELIEAKAKTGTFLTVLGFGMGNLKDSTLELLADKGNGAYGYVDSEAEAKKLLVDQVDSTLVTVAKDTKIQVEFNPARVGAWRLVGYENRVMANRDFNDDTKDAGDVGSGHTVTALYEIIPAGSAELEKLVKGDPLKYQGSVSTGTGLASADLMTVSLRYKEPAEDKSSLIEQAARDDAGERPTSNNFRFAAAVAMFGMELRGSEYKGFTNWALVDELAREAKGEDRNGLRAELLELIGLARGLSDPK